jgi:hypothetical protein
VIHQKTVFVLGAGASSHCGYVLGQKLYESIKTTLHRLPSNYDDIRDPSERKFDQYAPEEQLIELGYGIDFILKFREALKLADRESIDNFLSRREIFQEIGKVCIAQALIPYERNNVSGDWYRKLLHILDPEKGEFMQNKLSIVTFNYDRSLEHYLFNALKHIYGIDDDLSVTKMVEAIPIIHMHGQLGKLPWQSKGTNEYSRRYGGPITKACLKNAAASIKINSEELENDPEVLKARELIKKAEKLYFLGFGYDPINIRRLALGESAATLVGTGFGLTPNTEVRAREEFRRLPKEITISGMDIVKLFEVTRF